MFTDVFHTSVATLVEFVGYPGLFAIVFAESGVPFGFIFPGSSMLFTAGLLSSQGFFNPWILIPLVTLATILGDTAGYWIGARWGIKLFLRPDSRFFHHRHLERAKVFYDKYGDRTIVFARFIPFIRTFAPIIAGIVNMDYRRFLIYNIVGAILWATGITFSGYFVGAHVPIVADYLTWVIVGIIVVSFLPALWEYFKKRRQPDAPSGKG